MFSEKDIKRAKKIQDEQKYHIEKYGNRDSFGRITNVLNMMDNFKLIKLAQLENENIKLKKIIKDLYDGEEK